MTPLAFIHDLTWADLPDDVRDRISLHLLDLIGVAAGGLGTDLSHIIRAHAAAQFGGARPLLFDGRGASASGVALAAGMTIDALDSHDGYNPTKGHLGCPVLPALLALAPADLSGPEALTALCMAYEFGARAAVAQHGTVSDYHTSGSWGAVAAAAIGARLLRLDAAQTRHALGIAEYHGPRSQMMRCIDHPTMVKDGSGWGAMAGVSAALLARDGFTGAPAITVEEAPDYWEDLGQTWIVPRQYFKPWPVCRWAQAPVEAVLALRAAHDLTSDDVAQLEVWSFHEATRLATRRPETTEAAQYSTSFPCAVAMVHGEIAPEHIMGAALQDRDVLRLSDAMTFHEDADANEMFPRERIARVRLTLHNGRQVESGWARPKWDWQDAPSAQDISAKFHALADPVLGHVRAREIEQAVAELASGRWSRLAGLLSAAPQHALSAE
ncbi:MAG: MmgE/PrpD family protein [Pseudomonadota bacterium]